MQAIHYLPLVNKFLEENTKEVEIKEQKGGLFNKVYKITTHNGISIYIKQYLDQNVSSVFSPPEIPKEIRSKLAYTIHQECFLLNKDIGTVPKVLFDIKSNTILIESIEFPQDMINSISENNININTARPIAQTISRLHKNLSLKTYINDPFFQNEKFRDFKLKLQYYDLIDHLESELKPIILNLVKKYEKELFTVLHGDLNSRNIILNLKDANKLGIIDFEQSHIGNPIYDISYFLSEIYISCLYFENQELLERYICDFISTYSNYNPNFSLADFSMDLKKHIAVQILYRFYGPSKNSWTFYLLEESKKNEVINYAKTILYTGKDRFIDNFLDDI